jgi:type VI secretion system protein ImpG
MLESLLPYYERELGHLRALSGEFARRYPKIAGRLQIEGDQCADPHTERLIESFALLAARIHKKLDDDYPEVAESFLNVLYPHYLQPIPSASIVQFESDPARPELGRRYRVPRGQEVQAPAIGGVVCRFRSVYPVDLYPLSLQQARLELTSASPWLRQQAPEAAAVLTLEFQTQGGLPLGGLDLDELRFFLDGEAAQMHLLYELLLGHAQGVLVGDGSADPARTRRLPASVLQAVGFGPEEGMLEYDARSFMGYRLLTEYFCYPEKFLFVDVKSLGAVVRRLEGDRLVLRVLLDKYPDSERHHRLLNQLGPQHLKLGCTPIINLFQRPGEPIRVSHQKTSYGVLTDGRRQQAYEVVQVRRVVRVEKGSDGDATEEVPPFYAIQHGSRGESARFYWHMSRHDSMHQGDRGTEVELHLVDLDFKPMRPAAEVLSLELLCSNRDWPERIPFGGSQGAQRTDLSIPGHGVVKRVRLLRKPTASQRSPLGRGVQWRLISHLSLNYMSIVDSGVAALQEMLALYNLSDSAANGRQIQGVVGISSAPAVTRVAGRDFAGVVRGSEIRLKLDADYYVGGSVYLFASILERFFALYCAPNSFTRLRVETVQHQQEEMLWPARAGAALVI